MKPVSKKPKLPAITCMHCLNKIKSPKTTAQKYCSKTCKDLENNAQKIKKYHEKIARKIEKKARKKDPNYKYRKFCPGCGHYFDKYGFYYACSKKCLEEIRAMQHVPRKCRNCKSEITTPKKKYYCNANCKHEYFNWLSWNKRRLAHPETAYCKECDRELTERSQITFCSDECRKTHTRTIYDAKQKALGKNKPKKCRQCPKILHNRRLTYCSVSCKIESYKDELLKKTSRQEIHIKKEQDGTLSINSRLKQVKLKAEWKRRAILGLDTSDLETEMGIAVNAN